MYYVIERIEGPWAIIEYGQDSFRIPKSLLPSSAKQGDKIEIELQLVSDTARLRK